jgi:hypothetical protein
LLPWRIAHSRHHESDESGRDETGSRRRAGAAKRQGVTASSGPVMAPPSIAPPVVATAVPTIPEGPTAAPSTIPTPTVAPTPVATAPSTVPTTQPAAGGVSTTTTTGAQLPWEQLPTTEERHLKRAATEAAATLQTLQRAAGVDQEAQPRHWRQKGRRRTSSGRKPGQRSNGCGRWASNSKGKPKRKPPTRASRRLPKRHKTLRKQVDAASRRARQECMASVGALPLTGLQLPRAPEMIEPSERLEADCQDQVQALAQEILRRGAAAMAAGAASAGQGAQRPEGETGTRASRGATRPGTMPAPPTPTRTMGPPATTTGPQVLGGPPGPTPPTTAMRPEDRRPRGIRASTGPSVVTGSSSKVEFNAGMSRDDVIRALEGFLPNQFKELPEVAAEFGEGYAAPPEGAERTIAERFAQRVFH